jgi:DNA-directed RNA polymerase subunit M/transcription elongation factor TFIIS
MSDTSEIDVTAQRQTGVESKACPNCGAELAAVEQADGTTAYERCDSCYSEDPVAEPEVADGPVDNPDDSGNADSGDGSGNEDFSPDSR